MAGSASEHDRAQKSDTGSGRIVLCGGGTFNSTLYTDLIGTIPDASRESVLVDTSAVLHDSIALRRSNRIVRELNLAGCKAICIPRPLPSPHETAALIIDRKIRAIWFTGGTIGLISHRYRKTAVNTALHGLLENGGWVGGTSAGAVDLCARTWNQQSRSCQYGTGLGLAPNLLLAVHANRKNRRARLERLCIPSGEPGACTDDLKRISLPELNYGVFIHCLRREGCSLSEWRSPLGIEKCEGRVEEDDGKHVARSSHWRSSGGVSR